MTWETAELVDSGTNESPVEEDTAVIGRDLDRRLHLEGEIIVTGVPAADATKKAMNTRTKGEEITHDQESRGEGMGPTTLTVEGTKTTQTTDGGVQELTQGAGAVGKIANLTMTTIAGGQEVVAEAVAIVIMMEDRHLGADLVQGLIQEVFLVVVALKEVAGMDMEMTDTRKITTRGEEIDLTMILVAIRGDLQVGILDATTKRMAGAAEMLDHTIRQSRARCL